MAKIREKQLEKRRRETLDVALRLLFERGYANLNMDELAEEVGISKPTLYQDFSSKDEIVAQVIVRMSEHMAAELSGLADKSPPDQLEHLLRLMLKSRAEKRNIMAQLDNEVRRSIIQRYPYVKDHLLTNRNKLSQLVSKAQEQGDIDPSLPPWIVVSSLFTLSGVISNSFTKEDAQLSSEEVTEAIEGIVRLFKRGIGIGIPAKSSIPQ